MPASSNIEKRNRVTVTLYAHTGCRINGLRTLKVKHLDLADNQVYLGARDVETKFAKTFASLFVVIDPVQMNILQHYSDLLKANLLFGPNDPSFPAPERTFTKGKGFEYTALSQNPWQTTQPIRAVFKVAFENIGLLYYNPHSSRDMLTNYAIQNGAYMEQLIASSKSFGQNHPSIFINNYGSQSR